MTEDLLNFSSETWNSKSWADTTPYEWSERAQLEYIDTSSAGRDSYIWQAKDDGDQDREAGSTEHVESRSSGRSRSCSGVWNWTAGGGRGYPGGQVTGICTPDVGVDQTSSREAT